MKEHKQQELLMGMSYRREKGDAQYLNKQVSNLRMYRVTWGASVRYRLSPPPAPPPGWFVFSSAQVCKRLLIWSTLKKILFRDKTEICSLHLCTTQLFQLWFLLLFGTKVNRTTLQNRSVPGMLHARHGHSLFHELPPSAFSKDGLTQFHGQNTHPLGPFLPETGNQVFLSFGR